MNADQNPNHPSSSPTRPTSSEQRPGQLQPQQGSPLSVLEKLRIAATEPAGETGVTQVIAKRLPLYPQTGMEDGMWDAWWSDYFDALADLPTVALEAGMSAWVRSPESRFMPKPGELRHLALNTPNPTGKAYARELDQQRHEREWSGPILAAPPRENAGPKPCQACRMSMDFAGLCKREDCPHRNLAKQMGTGR
jgi:hypothetical protein